MADPLQASFGEPFPEQVAAYRARLGDLVPTAAWDDIERAAHDRAFMVAGAMKADLLDDLARAVDRAVSEGVGFEDFKADFLATAKRHGWNGWTGQGTKAGEHWRARVVYRTNLRTSYAAGRLAQLRASKFKFWVYRHGGSMEPRQEHLALDGLILEPSHPFWLIFAPPNGWGCSCYILGARSMAGAVRLGGDPSKTLPNDWDTKDPRTGAPFGIDKGWDYPPGGTTSALVSFAADKMRALPDRIAQDFGQSLTKLIDAAWLDWLQDIQNPRMRHRGLAGVLSLDDVQLLRGQGFEMASIPIHVQPGLVTGQKALRHARKGDALTDGQWKALPALIRRPQAVLIDKESGHVLMVLPSVDGQPQLAVALDRPAKRPAPVINEVISAYRPNMAELKRRIAAGRVTLLRGELG